ncbi:hypothetical protein GRI62_06680 [Erythrobacter arachoides]|uniref:UrcA family protein n=1 Tax=Aurantiacibacter arachoides TaxID=1850444 RepID=A0A844ZYC5_9SPHN|nr:hypothetical protein [Aurantiacibacter arachoides]MXO93291.1 hypothetical protein [Aurantiacibacter arachoides]GGD50463.1 hypothetical protein GCM10011411_07920 [Aurantiacibacter arachoides]
MTFPILAAAMIALVSSLASLQDSPPQETQPPLAVSPALPPAEADEAPAPVEAESDPGEEVVCRTERMTGSLTRRTRTCMTRNEWNGVESRMRDQHNRMTRSASGGQCIPSDPQSGRC